MKNTFSYDVKHEILNIRYDDYGPAIGSLCAIFQTLGEIVLNRGGFSISLVIDHDDMFDFVVQTIEKFYGKISADTKIHSSKRLGNDRREIDFDSELGRRLLFDTGIVNIEGGVTNINRGVEKNILADEATKIAYLSHAFAACGSITLPTEGKGGYHMEWAVSSDEVAGDIIQILTDFNVLPKKVKRGEKFVIYLKDRDVISDMVGRFGASKSMLKIAEMQLERDIRNQINRDANCMTANISKTVDASAKQIAAISIIEETMGIENLSSSLQEMAKARKADPQASIAALGTQLGISKSAARARLDSLVAIADNLSQ